MFENLEEWVTTLQSEFWSSWNLLSSKSVSDANREPQYSNLLLIKAFAKRTDVLGLEGDAFCRDLYHVLW